MVKFRLNCCVLSVSAPHSQCLISHQWIYLKYGDRGSRASTNLWVHTYLGIYWSPHNQKDGFSQSARYKVARCTGTVQDSEMNTPSKPGEKAQTEQSHSLSQTEKGKELTKLEKIRRRAVDFDSSQWLQGQWKMSTVMVNQLHNTNALINVTENYSIMFSE